MDVATLQDRVARGLGTAARHLGVPYDAFRPVDAQAPLAPAARFLRLPAAFSDQDQSLRRPAGYGRVGWAGFFDTAYTRVGDYLAGPAGTFFIAAQQSCLPALCVLTNRTVAASRAAAPALAGVNGYGGLTAATAVPILAGWPAAVLFAGGGSPGDLPGNADTPSWTVMLPPSAPALGPGDRITDDRGLAFVVGAAEQTALGWRIFAKQANP